MTLHPLDRGGESSKTQEYDESILLDSQDSSFLGPLISDLARRRGPTLPIFSISQKDVASALRKAALSLRLANLGPITPYRLRHSGASWDFASGKRALGEIQRRGRWRSSTSVRRYEKGGRLNEQVGRLDAATRTHALHCAKAVVKVLGGQLSPLKPP